MNPGICYLYEFKNNQKLRNVGFMKVTPHYRSCILQINARGIPVRNEDTVKLLAFYEQDSDIIAKQLDVLPCEDKHIYARLTVSDSAFPDGKTLEDLGGFLLLSTDGQYYAAVTDNLQFHTENITLWVEKPEPVMEEEPVAETETVVETETIPVAETVTETETIPKAEPKTETAANPIGETNSVLVTAPVSEMAPIMEAESIAACPCTPEEIPEPEITSEPDPACEQSSREKVRKIQRSEISVLPRRCWNLANNSFLMHGYHNYNHLLLVEEDGHYWLGVPGIYAPREARAAELFGFPQFTQAYTSQLELDDDEYDSSEKFGYWCRFIR